jgi:hypothetical protein
MVAGRAAWSYYAVGLLPTGQCMGPSGGRVDFDSLAFLHFSIASYETFEGTFEEIFRGTFEET